MIKIKLLQNLRFTKFVKKIITFQNKNKSIEEDFKKIFLKSSYIIFFKLQNLTIAQINVFRSFVLSFGYKFFFFKKAFVKFYFEKYKLLYIENLFDLIYNERILFLVINESEQIIINLLNELLFFKQMIYAFLIQFNTNYYSYNYFIQNIKNINLKKNIYLIIILKQIIKKKIFFILQIYLLKNIF